MLRILDPPMTTNRLRQELGIGLQATDEVPHLHCLASLALHYRDDTADTPEITPGRAIPQVLRDWRRDVGPFFPSAAILLLRGVAPRARQGLLLFEHLVEVVGEILAQMGLIVFD